MALSEKDLKKVVALSTLSHLGLIIIRCSLVGPLFGFLHLVIHAIFKALLFINIGYSIIRSGHNQDRRLLNINSDYLRIAVIFSLFGIIGFYFFNGFLSKDLILFLRISSRTKNLVILVLLILGFCFTTAYSIRFFISLFSFTKNIQLNLKKAFIKRTLMLIILSLISGEILKNFLLDRFLFFFSEKISFLVPLLALILGSLIYKKRTNFTKTSTVERILFLNLLFGNWLVKIILKFASFEVRKFNDNVNVLLETKINNNNLQLISNTSLVFLFFLSFLAGWFIFLIIIFSPYSLYKI